MKKLKLRMWVKVGIIIMIIIALISACEDYTNKAIDQCVNAGHSVNYCETGLR